MYNDVITVFNFHEKTGAWYTTVFKNVNLLEVTGETATRDSGRTNNDTVELIIRSVRLSYREPDTDEVRWYIGPKAYAKLDDPHGYFTFKAETDFFVVGNYSSEVPITDDDYDEGLYHAMNDAQDGVYMITSSAYFSLLPHFEIGGK